MFAEKPKILSSLSGWVTLAALAGCSAMAAPLRESEQRIASWLQAWDAQGTHRTATTGDEAGAAWLAREAAKIAGNGNVSSETFRLERIDTIAAFVEFAGERINGEPLFDGAATSAEGVHGSASDAQGTGPI